MKCCKINLEFQLTKIQQEASDQICKSYQEGKNVLIHAVCGAGKTELLYQTIQISLSKGSKVAIAIPRKDVVIELHSRIAKVFSNNHVVAVYGGHSDELIGDIIICTTHQLYRYADFFNLLIIDEVDAFPYDGNQVLENFALNCAKQFIFLSATPPEKFLQLKNNKEIDFVEINRRHHNYPLPVPKHLIVPHYLGWLFGIRLLRRFLKENKPVFIYAPTIKLAKIYYIIFKHFIPNIELVHSKIKNTQAIITKFKERKVNCLVTTTILERGVTFENLQVIVLNANHKLFTSQTLVQIAGRVGRKLATPTGEVIFVGLWNKNIKDAINQIKSSNKKLPNMF